MKYKPISCLVILFITLTFIFGCKKDDNSQNITVVPKVEYPGNYSFSTITSSYPDSTILYDGSISYDDFQKQWTVYFFPYQTIYPTIDDNGVMTYPEFVNNYPNGFFSGNFDGTGNVNFNFGYSIDHHGETLLTSYTVKGKKTD